MWPNFQEKRQSTEINANFTQLFKLLDKYIKGAILVMIREVNKNTTNEGEEFEGVGEKYQ